jgi:hypothetical protein
MGSASNDGLLNAGTSTEAKVMKSTLEGPETISINTLFVRILNQIASAP